MTDKLVKPQRVAARLDCGITQAKFKMRNDLGGWYEPGIGWRCRTTCAERGQRKQLCAACTYSQPQRDPEALRGAMEGMPRIAGAPTTCIADASANAGVVPNMAEQESSSVREITHKKH